jgi:hypothetical protein
MRKAWLITAMTGALVLAFGTGLLVAGSADHPREVGAAAPVSSKGVGGGCGMAAVTDTSTFTPDDDNSVEPDNTALKVPLKKSCSGPVVADFETEVFTDADGFIHATAFAKCVGGGCPLGVQKTAAPGHVFLQNEVNTTDTSGMVFVFHQLGRGKWQFRIGAGGDGGSSLEFRSLVVEAFPRP